MTYDTTYTWIRHDSVKAEYDTCFYVDQSVNCLLPSAIFTKLTVIQSVFFLDIFYSKFYPNLTTNILNMENVVDTCHGQMDEYIIP